MPKGKRLVYDNATYHIIQRGNNKQPLFKATKDYIKFISLIKKYKDKYNFKLYNYCLMENHVHFLMKALKKEELAKLTQGIFQSYSLYYKGKYNYLGHLYQGRYKSLIVEKDEYLLECARYIEINPLKANIVKILKDYPWSSYTYYAYGKQNSLLTPNPLYNIFTDSKKCKEFYKQYVLMPRMNESDLDRTFEF